MGPTVSPLRSAFYEFRQRTRIVFPLDLLRQAINTTPSGGDEPSPENPCGVSGYNLSYSLRQVLKCVLKSLLEGDLCC